MDEIRSKELLLGRTSFFSGGLLQLDMEFPSHVAISTGPVFLASRGLHQANSSPCEGPSNIQMNNQLIIFSLLELSII